MLVMILYIWDVTLSHWIIGSRCFVTAQWAHLRMVKMFKKFSLYIPQTVAQLAEALRYNPEGRGFDSRMCHWNFSLT
jgi:hypothetical protein